MVFDAMRTQWCYGLDGRPIGLRYEALGEVWRRLKVPLAARDAVFSDLQVLEDEWKKVVAPAA